MGKKHDYERVLKTVFSKGCVLEEAEGARFLVVQPEDIGIKVWGMIDYLRAEHGIGCILKSKRG